MGKPPAPQISMESRILQNEAREDQIEAIKSRTELMNRDRLIRFGARQVYNPLLGTGTASGSSPLRMGFGLGSL